MTVSYRWLNGVDATEEEWNKIEEVLVARGWSSLSRATTRIRIAEDESGQLVGFLVLQLFPMLGPYFVEPEMRFQGVGERLAQDMAQWLVDERARGFMVVAEHPHTEKLCHHYGLHPIPFPVYWATPQGEDDGTTKVA